MSNPASEPTTASSVDDALSKIKSVQEAAHARQAQQKQAVAFAEKTPHQIREYVLKQIEDNKHVSSELALKVLSHKPGEDLGIMDIDNNLSPGEAVSRILGTIRTYENTGVFEVPQLISPETAGARQAKADALAVKQGVIGSIILDLAATEPQQSSELLGRFLVSVMNNIEAVPQFVRVAIAQQLEEIAHPKNNPSLEELKAGQVFMQLPQADKLFPGLAEFRASIEKRIQAAEQKAEEEKKAREKAQGLEKHRIREGGLQKDTFEAARKLGSANADSANITTRKEINLGEGKEGFNTYLDIILKNPKILTALQVNRLDPTSIARGNPEINQLDILLFLHESPDLMLEAGQALAESVNTDWTGWSKADYAEANQPGRWQEVWQIHLKNTLYGYAVGLAEHQLAKKDDGYIPYQKETLQKAMNIILGETSLLTLNDGDSINEKFGAESNRALATAQLVLLIGQVDNEQLLMDMVTDETNGTRTNALVERKQTITNDVNQRKQSELQEVKKQQDLIKSVEDTVKSLAEALNQLELAMATYESAAALKTSSLEPNEVLTLSWKNGATETDSYEVKAKRVKAPQLEINHKKLEEARKAREINKTALASAEKTLGSDHPKTVEARRNLARANVQFDMITELQKQIEDLNQRVYCTPNGKNIYFDQYGILDKGYGRMNTQSEVALYKKRQANILEKRQETMRNITTIQKELQSASAVRRAEILTQLRNSIAILNTVSEDSRRLGQDLQQNYGIDSISKQLIYEATLGKKIRGMKPEMMDYQKNRPHDLHVNVYS